MKFRVSERTSESSDTHDIVSVKLEKTFISEFLPLPDDHAHTSSVLIGQVQLQGFGGITNLN